MLNILSKNWLLMVLRGVLSIVFGILMIIWPDVTVQVLVLLFGLFALMDGVYTSVLSIIFRNVLPQLGPCTGQWTGNGNSWHCSLCLD